MKYSNGTITQCYICISLSDLVSCAFSTIPICPFLIQRIFHSLVKLISWSVPTTKIISQRMLPTVSGSKRRGILMEPCLLAAREEAIPLAQQCQCVSMELSSLVNHPYFHHLRACARWTSAGIAEHACIVLTALLTHRAR